MKGRFLVAICLLSACSAPAATLVPDAEIVGDRLPTALTTVAGDIERGRLIFSNRNQGHSKAMSVQTSALLAIGSTPHNSDYVSSTIKLFSPER